MIAHQRLLEVLHYDSETGIFTWRSRTGNRVHIGQKAGFLCAGGYIGITIDRQTYLAHRLAWFLVTGMWPDCEIDHENTIRDDNRWINLRQATRAQNSHNKPVNKNNTSGIKGVSWNKQAKKWDVQIRFNGKRVYFKQFKTLDEAKIAADAVRLQLHGEFTRY